MRTLITLAIVAALYGCSDKPKGAPDDFGAAQAATTVVKAERACTAAGFEDLASCVEAPAQDVRRGAKTALDMADTYARLCAAEAGRDRCDEMLMSAYYVAKK